MEIKNYLIIALALAVILLIITRPKKEHSIDREQIQQARKDSARYAEEITELESRISDSKRSVSDTALWYQNKIKSLEGLNEPQIDSAFLIRYKQPITQIEVKREVLADLYRLDSLRAEVTHLKAVNSLQARMLKVKDDIIRTDSIQIRQIPNMEREIKRLRRANTLTKIGGVLGIVAVVLVAL